jgi:hypothetical protein
LVETVLDGIIIVGVSLAASLLGFVAVHRSVPARVRREHNDVAGFIYAILGIVYAILLTYVTIVVWERFDATSSTVELEAVAAGNIYHGADGFPEPGQSTVKRMVRSYVETTIDEEWSLLAHRQFSPKADQLAHDLRSAIDQLPVTTPTQQVMLDHELSQYETMISQRRVRILDAQVGVHPLLWGMLILGGIVTVGFTYLFGIEHVRAHALMIAMLAFVIGGMLFMIQQVNYPFSGDVHVTDEAFRAVLATFPT